MASGSRSRGRGSRTRGSPRACAAEAPSADDALLAPQLNPTFVAMPAAELVAHLNRYRRTADFVDAALVFAARERRLAEAEDLVRAGGELMDRLRDEIRAREYSALEAEAQIRRAAETEAALRAKIRALQLSAADAKARAPHGSGGISGHGLTQQAGHGREPVPQDFITASDDGVGFDATGVQTMFADGEVGDDDVPMKTRHGALWSRAAPALPGAALLPDTLIDDERAAEQVATDVLSSNEEAQGDREVSEDVLTARVTAGRRKVSEEEAQGEDVAASRHRRSQGEKQAARATKKARRHKGTCFYNKVFNALKEKEELLKKKESLVIAKEAAAAASKQLHCRCWSNAPYMPSKSAAVEEDSGDDSQN